MDADLNVENLLGRTEELSNYFGHSKTRSNLQAKMAWMMAKMFNAPQNQVKTDMVRQLAEVFVSALQMVNQLEGEEQFKGEILGRLTWMEETVKAEIEKSIKTGSKT
jgi:hypothetical protein